MKVYPVQLDTYNRRKDGSVRFSTSSMLKLESEEIGTIDAHLGNVAMLVITDQYNLDNLNVDDIIKELPENLDDKILKSGKSQSERIRNVLYIRLKEELERNPTEEEFARFYKKETERIILDEKIKLKPKF